MILLTQQYDGDTPERQKELDQCARENLCGGLFEEYRPIRTDGDERRTYGEFFRLCADEYADEVCVLANSDILFDTTAKLIYTMADEGRIIALTRWELGAGSPRLLGRFHDERFYSGTQDTWAFIGGDLVGIGDNVPMGFVGCDQALLGECVLADIVIGNPALSIQTWHVHAERGRPNRPFVSGLYAYPELTTTRLSLSVVTHHWPEKK